MADAPPALKVLVTVPGETSGRRLAQALLRSRLGPDVEVAIAGTIDEVWRVLREKGWEAGPDLAVVALETPARPRSGRAEAEGQAGDLPGGLELVARLRRGSARPEIVAVTDGSRGGLAALAFEAGVWDVVEVPARFYGETARPPVRDRIMGLVVASAERAGDYLRGTRAAASSGVPAATIGRAHRRVLDRRGVVGESQALLAALDAAAEAADSEASALIDGESGTGKELFARLIHANSERRRGPFVVVDCASMPWTLAESELFGHVRGAFTGADRARDGLLTLADGGTLFLDELGELPLTVQKVFLRALEERRYRPLGADRELSSDFRLLAATNRNLDEMAAKGAFRSDLLFRVRALSLHLPPLRERKGDVALLAAHLARRRAERYGGKPQRFSPDFLEVLEHYSWPGNVREFANALERAFSSAGNEPTLYPAHLPVYIRARVASESIAWERGEGGRRRHEARPAPQAARDASEVHAGGTPQAGVSNLPPLKTFRAEQERRYLRELLRSCQAATGESGGRTGNGGSEAGGWRVEDACRISGMSRARLYALLKKHGFLRRWEGGAEGGREGGRAGDASSEDVSLGASAGAFTDAPAGGFDESAKERQEAVPAAEGPTARESS